MHGSVHAARCVEAHPLAVAQARDEALRRGELLPGLAGVVAPDAGPGLELGAGLGARHVRHAVLRLAGIRRRAEIDEEIALVVDDEGMHGVIAGDRQAGHDDIRLPLRHGLPPLQLVAHNAVVQFGIERALVERDAGAAGGTLRDARAEALHEIGAAGALGILERKEESTRRRLVEMVVAAAPGIDVEDAVRCHNHMADMAEIVGENRRAEARREGDAGILGATHRGRNLGRRSLGRRSLGRRSLGRRCLGERPRGRRQGAQGGQRGRQRGPAEMPQALNPQTMGHVFHSGMARWCDARLTT